MKCQKDKVCVKQPGNAIMPKGKRCTGCDKPTKDKIVGLGTLLKRTRSFVAKETKTMKDKSIKREGKKHKCPG